MFNQVAAAAVLTLLLCPVAAAAQQDPAAPPPIADVRASGTPSPDTRSVDVAAPQQFFDGMAPLPAEAVPWPALQSTGDAGTVAPVGEVNVRYIVDVTGLAALNLMSRFNELSELHKERNDPANIAQIRRRTIADVALADQLLRSVGHFGATVTSKIVAPAGGSNPTHVEIIVDPGPVYTFGQIDIVAPTPVAAAVAAAALGIKAGDKAATAQFAAAQDGVRVALADKGYPFPVIGDPDIVIDHATRTATLTQKIDPGPKGRFGAVISDGAAQITSRHMQRLVRFKPGDRYSNIEVEDLRRALIATSLYGSVVIKPVKAGTNADGSVNVDLVVTGETAPLRTVSATAGYSTGEGIRLAGSWQHRNLLPPQGQVTFNSVVAQRELALGAELRRRNWLERDRTLVAAATLSTQHQDAYNATTLSIGAHVELETNLIWQKKWYYSIGAEFAASNEADLSQSVGINGPRTLYYIFTVPLSINLDNSDNLLNPERGFRLSARLAPQVSFQSGNFYYAIAQIEGTYYWQASRRFTLATRLHLGSIIGAARGDIAPTRRFYAGGGGSVRGYNYQQVGPKDPEGVPTGGNSITEASIEARIRFGDWGVVPFVDAGQVFSSTVPNFSAMSFGAGIGVRYYTSFGPVRFDVATPINPGPNDPKIAFYVSIGQAF